MSPCLAAVLHKASFALAVFIVAHVCENAAFPVVTSSCFPGPVVACRAIVLETNKVSVVLENAVPCHLTATAAEFPRHFVVRLPAGVSAVVSLPISVTLLSVPGLTGAFFGGVFPPLPALSEGQWRFTADCAGGVGSEDLVDHLSDERALVFLGPVSACSEVVVRQ